MGRGLEILGRVSGELEEDLQWVLKGRTGGELEGGFGDI